MSGLRVPGNFDLPLYRKDVYGGILCCKNSVQFLYNENEDAYVERCVSYSRLGRRRIREDAGKKS